MRGSLAPAVYVFELERAANAQELEVRSDEQLTAAGPAHARFHGRPQSVDVQPYPGARVDLGLFQGRFFFGLRRAHAAQVPKGRHAGAIEVGKSDTELAAARLFSSPDDVGLGRDLLRTAAETTQERLTDFGQIGRSQVHPARRKIDALGLESATRVDLAADLDDGFERNAQGFGVSPVFMNAHRMPPSRDFLVPYGRNPTLAKFWSSIARRRTILGVRVHSSASPWGDAAHGDCPLGSSSQRREREEPLSIGFDSPMVVVGRGEGSEVRLPDPSVSHRHATIRQRGSEYILVDEGSTNGTFMGGVKLGAQAPRILRHGDLARVGRVWLEVRFDHQVPPAQTVLATKELALLLVARAMAAEGDAGGPRITVVSGPDQGKAVALEEPSRAYVIGRGQDADLVLEDTDASRRHVQVVRRANQLLVRDLGSKNGAHLASEKVSERDRIWRQGETLTIGQNVFAYEHPAIEALLELERAADEKSAKAK